MSNTVKIKGIFLNDNECLMPSALTQSKVFQVISKKNQKLRKEKCKDTEVRTKFEVHTYTGFNLDLQYDYPILHLLLSEKQKQKSNVISINLNSLLKAMKIQVRPENRIKVYKRIKDFSECQISIVKYNGDGNLHELPEVTTRLVLEIRKISSEVFSISFPPELDLFVELFDTQLIKFDDYKRIKLQSAKGVFLTIKSHAFISVNYLKIPFTKFKVHYDESRPDKQIAQDLREGFKHLVDLGFIKSYEETKTKNGSKTFSIRIKDNGH